MHPTDGFVPVIHGAVDGRPDEEDTLVTAQAVAEALDRLGYEAPIIHVDLDLGLLRGLVARRPHVVFNLVESLVGDGALAFLPAAVLDHLGLAYTGAPTAAYALTCSKLSTKERLAAAGLPTPALHAGGRAAGLRGLVIVKPDAEHASFGIDAGSVVDAGEAAAEMRRRERHFGGRFFAERFIEGRELNAALIEHEHGPRVLPIAEILLDDLPPGQPRIVDYAAKWQPESIAYQATPRRFGLETTEPRLAAKVADLALRAWHAVGLAGYARVDFRVDLDGEPTILEVNANPCLAPDSGFVATAAAAGIGYDALIERIVAAAAGRLARAA